jgi:class 3 adenylate cyclase
MGKRNQGGNESRRALDAPAVTVERVRATVLVAELRGFGALAGSSEPRRVVRVLGDFLSALTDVAVGHQAEIGAPVGTTLMLLFGTPRPRRDAAVRAVRTAVDLQRAFLAVRNRWLAKRWEAARPLGLGVGVATDLLLIANLDLNRGTAGVPVGEAVTRAARLCRAAATGESLLDDPTYAVVRSVLDEKALFTSREMQRGGESTSAYRVQLRRAGLYPVRGALRTDPVCRVEIEASAALRRRVAGRVLYFCSRRCADRFASDPEKFAS